MFKTTLASILFPLADVSTKETKSSKICRADPIWVAMTNYKFNSMQLKS